MSPLFKLLCITLILAFAAREIRAECKHFTTNDEVYRWYEEIRGSQVTFNVKAEKDAVINLYIDKAPHNPALNYYRIVLGGEKNTIANITNMGHPSTTVTVNGSFLNANQFETFWVKKENGLVEVGKFNEPTPFMMIEDPDVVPVNYFAFQGADHDINYWQYCPQGTICTEYTTIGDLESVTNNLEAVPGTLAHLDFQVLLGGPAITLNARLCDISFPSTEAPCYRIEFDSGANINIYEGSKLLSTQGSPGIPSNVEVTGLWIDASGDVLQVGLANSPNVPLATANITLPHLEVMYYSFIGGTPDEPGVWLVDCV